MLPLRPGDVREIVVVGAHCDDIAIGAGGALLSLCGGSAPPKVTALVLTGGGTPREAEEHAALQAFCRGAELKLTVLDLPDGRVPAHWERAKLAVEDLRRQANPDLLLAPARHDAHQDHRALAKLVPTAFRDHLVLGYEIAKWDGDLAQPTAFVPLDPEVAEAKSALLLEHYRSQHGRSWFDRETFLGLLRLRGVQCQARYAEGFFVDKLVFELGAPAGKGDTT
ncbi:PIG-L family deacetylase [Solihabitans fulvus]|uniref:PIG-L family deacetylase n=1 Tax=Solihabitans fulvus TaxID=1892852 RepID=A0A5B2XC76_9PSEU|nr:PIG-L deacetylase family protein [Solihabitans fulvus]KAA2261187.1 PIG-L family deacetylase [Solihabitans fulvus]